MRIFQTLPFVVSLFFTLPAFSQATRFEPGLFPENEAFGLTLSPNGRELFFIHSHGERDTLKLMYSVKRGDQWMKPVPAPFITNNAKIIDPFISPDGKLLLYNSDQPREDGSRKGFDIYGVKKTKNGWGEPFRYNDVINIK